MKYAPVLSGETMELKPLGKGRRAWKVLRMACCDCGLIHSLAFAIEDNGNLGIAVRRENRATAARRRGKAFRGLKLPPKT